MRTVVAFVPLVLAACLAAPSEEPGTPIAAWSCGTAGLLGNSSAVERCALGESDGTARAAPPATPEQSTAQPALRDDEVVAAGRESAGTSESRRGSLFTGRQDVGTAGALDMIRTIAPLR